MSTVRDEDDTSPEEQGSESGSDVESAANINTGHKPEASEDVSDTSSETAATPRAAQGEGPFGPDSQATFSRYASIRNGQHIEDNVPPKSPLNGRPSTPEQSVSNTDDSHSVQDSLIASPRRGSRVDSPNPPLRPFERRFKARPSLSPHVSSRAESPAMLGHRARQPSLVSQIFSDSGDAGTPDVPWDVVRWTRLRKVSGESFSESGKRNFGRPTCITVSSCIAIGTTKGAILVFDYHQNLKSIIGLGTKATECGAITAIALSADNSTVAGGHAEGNIFTWEIARPAKPFLHIAPLTLTQVQNPKQDGHIQGVAVLHLGFLGARHTALVSADNKGMAFSHLASRGMGAIVRTLHTTRVLGRYPDLQTPLAQARKPSSVLAFSPLPLGNAINASDEMGFVAMLTPYLLVIVSTTPVAQTQHKASRPKEVAAHGALSGALAWYPSMKDASGANNPKIAYSWLNVLTILEMVEIPASEPSEKDRPPEFRFNFKKRWQAEESIVAIQWVGKNVLAVVTITQQLLLIDDNSLYVTESSDLLKKNIFHTDHFTEQLTPLVEHLDEDNEWMHGVVADAFYMSFRTYKGRLFLLGFNDISLGTLSNWADRLIALMEQGDYVASIQLAASYHSGTVEMNTAGLPEDPRARRKLVKEKLTEIMSASLRYAFGQNEASGTPRVSDEQLESLANACYAACLQVDDMDFLFEEVFSWYNEKHAGSIFLSLLETHVLEGQIRTVPPVVLKEMVNTYIQRGDNTRLEELICRLSPETMDIDQLTSLCRQHKLYDALFYVWSQAIGDYTTVVKNLLDEQSEDEAHNEEMSSSIYPYLSYTLTSRVYPTGEDMDETVSDRAKIDLYFLLFSGIPNQTAETRSSFEYLKKLLDLDTANFMSMLNEVFEDSFLNGSSDAENGDHGTASTEEQRFRLSLNRQYILRILLQVLTPPDYESTDIVYLDMFIARNLPKFQQFILLPGHVLHRVLLELCQYSGDEMAEDCQLSVEYLLSVYQPPDLPALIPAFFEARFYKVIKFIYAAEKQYALLLQTCFEDDQNPEAVFDCIRDCLRPQSGLNDSQRTEIRKVLSENSIALLRAGISETASCMEAYLPDLHDHMLRTLQNDEHAQYQYLREVLESPPDARSSKSVTQRPPAFIENYVRLLCDYDPQHVSDYIETLNDTDLRLSEVLPALESGGAIDAAVMLMAREGDVRKALDRLIQQLRTLEASLLGLIGAAEVAPDLESSREALHDLTLSLEKYVRIGIWLCQRRLEPIQHGSKGSKGREDKRRSKRYSRLPSEYTEDQLSSNEMLWLDLIDGVVQVMRTISDAVEPPMPSRLDGTASLDLAKRDGSHPFSHILPRIRLITQSTFTALLTSTSSPASQTSSSSNAPLNGGSFLPILSAFLFRASSSSPSLAHLRSVLSSIFSAYAYEEGLLGLANQLLDKDLFKRIEQVQEGRKRGWRPLGMTCSGCGKRCWGPGAGRGIWDAWVAKEDVETEARDHWPTSSKASDAKSQQEYGKGKEKASEEQQVGKDDDTTSSMDALVVFSCRHLFHRRCLDTVMANTRESGAVDGVQLWCPLEEKEASEADSE